MAKAKGFISVRFLRSGGKAAEGAPPAMGPGAGICADVSASSIRIGLASSRDRDRALQLSQLAIDLSSSRNARRRTSALQRDGGGVAGLGQRDGERPVDGHAERHVAGEDEARAAGARVHQRRQGPAAVLRRRRAAAAGAVGEEVEAGGEAGDQRRRARRRPGLPRRRRRQRSHHREQPHDQVQLQPHRSSDELVAGSWPPPLAALTSQLDRSRCKEVALDGLANGDASLIGAGNGLVFKRSIGGTFACCEMMPRW